MNTKKILYVDMDNVLVDFPSGLLKCDKTILKEFQGREDEIPGIFGQMEPMKHSIECYNELCAYFDTYLLSTSPWENESALVDKLKWVKKYLGNVAHKRLILSHHKNLNIGDFLIDDRTKNGAAEFVGELIRFGSDEFPDWLVVKEYLLKNI